jgi:hypothetical protein
MVPEIDTAENEIRRVDEPNKNHAPSSGNVFDEVPVKSGSLRTTMLKQGKLFGGDFFLVISLENRWSGFRDTQ